MKPRIKTSTDTFIQSLKVDWIEFHDTVFSESWLHELVDFLNNLKKPIFSRQWLKVYYLWMSDFLAEFDSELEMQSYLSQVGALQFSWNKEKQLPKIRGYFYYEGKYFIILWAEYNFEDNIEDTDYWYRGIIFDIDWYSRIWWALQETKNWTRTLL